jgi:hypothetical protein
MGYIAETLPQKKKKKKRILNHTITSSRSDALSHPIQGELE